MSLVLAEGLLSANIGCPSESAAGDRTAWGPRRLLSGVSFEAMALTEFQRTVCRVIARNRQDAGESYVAGGVALNLATGASRLSHDIDLFHDTEEALEVTWDSDRVLLESQGFTVDTIRERPYFVEAQVLRDDDSVLMQWARDSAYRFFPLVKDDDLGLVLHPFDLATNKVLALVGRLEVRDWVDTISCHKTIQPLGYLAWAACGKDPGFSPALILEQAGRTCRYSKDELASLAFDGAPPDAAELSRAWHAMLADAEEIVALLPADEVGKCVVDSRGALVDKGHGDVAAALERGELRFHSGSIRGALPQPVG